MKTKCSFVVLFLLVLSCHSHAQESERFVKDSLLPIFQQFVGRTYGELIGELEHHGISSDRNIIYFYGGSFFGTHEPTVTYPWTWNTNPWKSAIIIITLHMKKVGFSPFLYSNMEYSENQLYEENPKYQPWFDSFMDKADTLLGREVMKKADTTIINVCGEKKWEDFKRIKSLRNAEITSLEIKTILGKSFGKILKDLFQEQFEYFEKEIFPEIYMKELPGVY